MLTPHGKYEISVRDYQITTTLFGSYNTQGIEAWISEMKKSILSFSGEPFVILVNELEATGATPEALERGNEYNEWLNHQSLVAKAVVYSEDIYEEIDKKSLPARSQQNIKFFKKVKDAQLWLNNEWQCFNPNP